MERRQFLKIVAGIAGAVVAGVQIKAAPMLSRVPRGMPFVINEATTVFPELKAPVPDAHGSAITFADFERAMVKLKDDADKIGQPCFDASEAYFRGQLRERGLLSLAIAP